MSVYLIIEIKVKDNELYSKYVEKVPEVIESYGGRYLIRGGEVTSFSGNWYPERIILIEFETIEQLQNCFQSDEYLKLSSLRKQSTISKAIIVEGYVPPE